MFILYSGIQSALLIGSVSLGSSLVQKILEEYGHEKYIPMMKVIAYVIVNYIGIDFTVDILRDIARKFGVYL